MTYDDLVRTEILKCRFVDQEASKGLETLCRQAQDPHLQETLAALGVRASFRARRLEDLCARRGWSAEPVPSRCVQGVQAEAREDLGRMPPGSLADAVVVCVALRLMHLGIASYQVALALAVEEPDLIRTLARSLDEARQADMELDWVLRSAVVPSATKDGAIDSDPRRTRR